MANELDNFRQLLCERQRRQTDKNFYTLELTLAQVEGQIDEVAFDLIRLVEIYDKLLAAEDLDKQTRTESEHERKLLLDVLDTGMAAIANRLSTLYRRVQARHEGMMEEHRR